MKPEIAASLAFRFFGVIAILLGIACVGSVAISRYQWFLAPVPRVVPERFAHDTYYVIYTAHFAPGVFSILLGIISLAFSRPLGRLLTRGLVKPIDQQKQ
jgi:uncharacterized membrane protein HdeD (DUF308 family)